jgi:hypothetical protein
MVLNNKTKEADFKSTSKAHTPGIMGRFTKPFDMLILDSYISLAFCEYSTRMKLKKRGIELDMRYPVCYRLDEDGGILFANQLRLFGGRRGWKIHHYSSTYG